ncbi:FkbM family methyltransferase [Streptomyces sp. NBC_00268]|uniref:FkbM family methyltransferase n=1 Tax=Streptomyces sp. NBC_00268 TaxID=2975695 RepID=UPI002B1E78CA|nr:FkbM family methyltransferase [Streptomyces sp. NBC_00268]
MIPPLTLRVLRAYIRHAPGHLGKPWLAGHLNTLLKEHPLTTTARTGSGMVFPVATSDVIQRYLYLFGVWEPHLTAFISGRLTPKDTFVDVGANIGYYSVLASRLVGPAGHVVAVEPSPDFHQALVANAQGNGCGNVRTVNAAVFDSPGRMTFYLERSTNLGGTTAVRPRTVESSFESDAAPLPQLVREEELATARLIKIHVEGGEAGAVRGLLPALPRLRDDAEILVEVTPCLLTKQGQTVDDVLGPLREHGFHVYRIANDYAAVSYPGALRRPVPAVRWREPINEMTDLVLSRTKAEVLLPIR